MKIKIKELLKHVYPSCKVIVYCGDDKDIFSVGFYYDLVGDDEYCDDFAFYKNHLAIFM